MTQPHFVDVDDSIVSTVVVLLLLMIGMDPLVEFLSVHGSSVACLVATIGPPCKVDVDDTALLVLENR